jgi:hypothetical protein
MKTKRIKAAKTMTPLIGCPGAEGLSYILPADADSYERMVKQVAAAICRNSTNVFGYGPSGYTDQAVAALRAIGITQPKQKKGTQ